MSLPLETTIEDTRLTLRNQRIADFLSSLQNQDSPRDERQSLYKVIQTSITQLLQLEKNQLKNFFDDEVEEICPGCLHDASWRAAQAKSLAALFNDLVESSSHNH